MKRKSVPTEKEIQTQIMDYLRLVGVLAVRINSGAVIGSYKGKKRFVRFNDTPGCSDILACLPPDGRWLALEVKRPGASTIAERRIRQNLFLDRVRQAGGIGCYVRSLDDLFRVLLAEGYGHLTPQAAQSHCPVTPGPRPAEPKR